MLVLGIVASGGIFSATNPAYTAREVSYHIKASNASFVITEPEVLPAILEVANESGSLIRDIWIFHPLKDQNVPPGHKSWKELLNKGELDWVRFDGEELSRETTAFRLFSSGTTGLPKAVDITHRNLVAQYVGVNEYKPKPYEVGHLFTQRCSSYGLLIFCIIKAINCYTSSHVSRLLCSARSRCPPQSWSNGIYPPPLRPRAISRHDRKV